MKALVVVRYISSPSNSGTLFVMQKHVGDNTAELITVVYGMSNTRGKELCERVWDGRFRDVEGLLKAGVNVNYKDRRSVENGWTPLHTAAAAGRVNMVKLLLVYDADATIKNNEGQTPVETAIGVGNQEIVNIFEDDTIVYRLKQRYELIEQQMKEGQLDEESSNLAKQKLFGGRVGAKPGGFLEYCQLAEQGKAPKFNANDFNDLLDKQSSDQKLANERKEFIASLNK